MQEFNHQTFISPFTWRYGSEAMRRIFSEVHKRTLLRTIWIALARAQMRVGLVTEEQLAELEATKDRIDIARATQIESEIHHDLMAEIHTWAEQCPNGGKIIHLGATSMDVLDNMDALRLTEALDLTISKTRELLILFKEKMEAYRELPTMAFTHIQPAEPSTVGYRFAQSAQDLKEDLEELIRVRSSIRGKGMKGAVGTAASYAQLLEGTGLTAIELEEAVMEEIGLAAYTASTQIYTRKQDLRVAQALSGLAATLSKFFFDFRILMSPPIGEWSEYFASKQVGSSAMPFKRNPINSEKINSLCRLVSTHVDLFWQNAATTVLERSLDDSANRRIAIPEIFLAVDEILVTAIRTVGRMTVHEEAVGRNLNAYGLFAASERLLMELGRRGADRQAMHELIRNHSLKAWEAVRSGKENPLAKSLSKDKKVLAFVTEAEVLEFMKVEAYIGDAVLRTTMVAKEIDAFLNRD
ncbi:MAG TPA: adenylosuccinate lyase [Sphaerochaeta sp.]|jgi:adenylosuccinate lyase|nr:adenylosuccinate lyase [Sphaerochaeta sp.]HOR80487.1 adenylosuccinate lyase [Sphaerochaeta sp.]HPK64218.1 adenylosuccinate lyase [Sphaerochaeta sp.]